MSELRKVYLQWIGAILFLLIGILGIIFHADIFFIFICFGIAIFALFNIFAIYRKP